jgi:phospholipase A1
MPVDTVIFVPGICGSVLREGDQTVWPGTPANAVFGSYPDEFVRILATSETITAPDVLRSVPLTILGMHIYHFAAYGGALNALEKKLGYNETSGTLIPFPYDWRRDVRSSAKLLHDRLSQADLKGPRVGIVAHSMGGLVARYALEKLGVPAGLNLEVLALLATPHLGAPAALQNLLGLRPEIFLSARQCREVLKNSEFPAGYQLLPRPGIPALLRKSPRVGFSVLDLFGPAAPPEFGLIDASLEAARQLSQELPFMGPSFSPPCPYFAIVGNAQKTIVSNYHVDDHATPVEEGDSGDGTVPLWSAAPPGIPVRYVAASHMEVCTDPDATAMLQAVFRPDLPGGRLLNIGAGSASLTLQPLKSSVSPQETFTVAVVADRPTNAIETEVVLRRAFSEDVSDSQVVPVQYRGGIIRSIPLEFTAPNERSVLVFELRDVQGAMQGKRASVLVIP